MVRWLARTSVQILPVLALIALTAGCGGDANIGVRLPPPATPGGPTVTGIVKLPNSAGIVVAVGRGVEVRLSRLLSNGIEDVQAGSTSVLTNDQGLFGDDPIFGVLKLPTGQTEDTCRFILTVNAGTVNETRAFVTSTSQAITVDFASEAAVRQVLDRVLPPQPPKLCDFSSSELRDIAAEIRPLPGISGTTPAQINSSANQAAASSPVVQATINAALGVPTVGPTEAEPTETSSPAVATATRTSTVPVNTSTPLPSNTPSPTRTSTTAPTATNTAVPPTATNTAPPTATNTPVPPTATNTAPPTATNTRPPTATNTPQPTATNTPQPTATNTATRTATATNTPQPTATKTPVPPTATNTTVPTHTPTSTPVPPTATNTPAATATDTAVPPTATATSPPVAGVDVNVGTGSGAPGATVTITVSLANAGGMVASTSNDIIFNSTQVDALLMPDTTPDCTIDPRIGPGTAANKNLLPSLLAGPNANEKILRVGVINFLNSNLITDGTLFSCKFKIQDGASLGDKLLANVPGAANPDGDDLTNVGGTNGTITVISAEPSATPTNTQPVAPTSTPTPTATNTQPPTPTDTQPPAATATSTSPPAGGVAVNVGSASGAAGDTVMIAVSLANAGGMVASTSTDITFNSTQVDALLMPDTTPDCTIDPRIGPGTAANKNLLPSVLAGPNANEKILRVGVINFLNSNLITDGTLFSCKFKIQAAATPGDKLLANVPGAANPDGDDLTNVGGTNGTITVLPPAGPAVNVGSASGTIGATVMVVVSLANAGGMVASTSTDITFDSTQVAALLMPDTTPDCTIDPRVGPGTAANKNLLPSVLAGPNANEKILRVGVINFLNSNLITDGALFSCKFKIQDGASLGDKLLANVPGAANPDGDDLTNVGGTNGTITVTAP